MKPKILLVDDDALIHQLYGPHLERAGYQVVGARDGEQAVELANKELPQVVIMDLIMNKVDGLEAVLALRRARSTKAIPVILISADAQFYGCERQFAEIGAQGFLSKPFSPMRLLGEVRRVDTEADRPLIEV